VYCPSHFVEKLIFVPEIGRGTLLPFLMREKDFSSESFLLEEEVTTLLTAEEIS
jgi:hypothetical protein